MPLLCLALLFACSNTDDTFEVAQSVLFPRQQAFDARFQVAAQNNARVLKLALLDFDEGYLILFDSRRDGINTWITADGGTISTKQGMLVAMNGFGAGLLAADIDQPLAMVKARQEGPSERFHTYLTGNDETVTRTYKCVIVNQGAQEIVVGNAPLSAQLLSEDCRSLDRSFQNLYWVSPNRSEILQTSQWTGKFVGTIATQVVP